MLRKGVKKTGKEFRAKTNGKEFRVMLRQRAKKTGKEFRAKTNRKEFRVMMSNAKTGSQKYPFKV